MVIGEIRRAVRALLLLLHILLGVLITLGVVLMPAAARARSVPPLRRWWLSRSGAILGLKVMNHGAPAAGPVLLVANHISWLDILVLATQSRACFVAKAEISDWPVIGWLAEVGGTLFIRRGDHKSYREVLATVIRRLQGGEPIVVFPEGTSHAAVSPAQFRPRMFQAAVDAGAGVQPVALYYGVGSDNLGRIAYVGDDTFVRSLWELLGERRLLAEVTFLPMLPSSGQSCRELATEAWLGVVRATEQLAAFEHEAHHHSDASAEQETAAPRHPVTP
ncbi:MAG TPA: lysophospholipid acyltransferase family protein [Gammaproteobacteria bacterium]|nr:lysophospholipid acyltransferase family protein [Gammaproteobacteria bacterium]